MDRYPVRWPPGPSPQEVHFRYYDACPGRTPVRPPLLFIHGAGQWGKGGGAPSNVCAHCADQSADLCSAFICSTATDRFGPSCLGFGASRSDWISASPAVLAAPLVPSMSVANLTCPRRKGGVPAWTPAPPPGCDGRLWPDAAVRMPGGHSVVLDLLGHGRSAPPPNPGGGGVRSQDATRAATVFCGSV